MSAWDISICRGNNGKWYVDFTFDPDMMSTYRALINLDDSNDVPLSVDAGAWGGFKFTQPGFAIEEVIQLKDPRVSEDMAIKAVRLWNAKAYLTAWGKASEEGQRLPTPADAPEYPDVDARNSAVESGESWNSSVGSDRISSHAPSVSTSVPVHNEGCSNDLPF